MGKYCNCIYCLKNETIDNPYDIYRKKFPLKEIELSFDYRASAMCRFGCEKFKKKATCPPNIPEIEFFRRVLNGYRYIYILGRQYPYDDGFFSTHWRTYSTNEVHDLLLKKERELFKEGSVYAKAFIGGSCKVCSSDNCDPERCRIPGKGRIPLEATGINIFSLINSLGLEYEEPPVHFFWRIGAVFY